MRRTSSTLAAAVVVALVFLAGCGGVDGDGDAAPPTSSPTTTVEAVVTTVAPEVTTTAGATVAPTTAPRATTPPSPPAPVTLACPDIQFDDSGENAASRVTATGLSCEDASAFIRQVRTTLTAVGPASADLEGYHCVRTGQEDYGLPSSEYECTAGARKVTFVKT